MRAAPHVIDWLNYFGLPYDDVTSTKPDADFYVDDKAIRFVSWDQTLRSVGVLL